MKVYLHRPRSRLTTSTLASKRSALHIVVILEAHQYPSVRSVPFSIRSFPVIDVDAVAVSRIFERTKRPVANQLRGHEVDAPMVPDPPVVRITEAEMIDRLVARYTRISMNAHRYAFADHVPTRPGFPDRVADFMAIDCYSAGPWPNRRHEIHGHEIKVSRSDWLTELRDPSKSEAFRPYCHRWWLVVSDASFVRDGELPEGWGLLVRQGSSVRALKKAPLLEPEPMPTPMTAAFARAVAKTAHRLTSASRNVVSGNPNGERCE